MTEYLVDEGRPVPVSSQALRIASGPWGRWLVTAVVPDESDQRAERGRRLARAGAVRGVTVSAGAIAAQVTGDSGRDYLVGLRADPVPPRVWQAVTASVAGRELVAAALEGRARAVGLEHAMSVDWEEPLVPRARTVHRICDCPDHDLLGSSRACKHVAALAYVVARLVDRDFSLLLRWRGCEQPPHARRETGAHAIPGPEPVLADDGIWEAGELPEIADARPLPAGAVVKRLGRSGIRVGGEDLAEALLPAYVALASPHAGSPPASEKRTGPGLQDDPPGASAAPRTPAGTCRGTTCDL